MIIAAFAATVLDTRINIHKAYSFVDQLTRLMIPSLACPILNYITSNIIREKLAQNHAKSCTHQSQTDGLSTEPSTQRRSLVLTVRVHSSKILFSCSYRPGKGNCLVRSSTRLCKSNTLSFKGKSGEARNFKKSWSLDPGADFLASSAICTPS